MAVRSPLAATATLFGQRYISTRQYTDCRNVNMYVAKDPVPYCFTEYLKGSASLNNHRDYNNGGASHSPGTTVSCRSFYRDTRE